MDIAEISDVAVAIVQEDREAPSTSSHDIEGAPSKQRPWRCYALLAVAILSLSIGATVGVKSSKKEKSRPTVGQDFTDFDDGYYSYVLGVIVDQAAPSAISLSDLPKSTKLGFGMARLSRHHVLERAVRTGSAICLVCLVFCDGWSWLLGQRVALGGS